jgi:mannose-6-phosphate isomerase-like protein (cupin superfamily)
MSEFATKRLPADPTDKAPDGSDVRVLLGLQGGGMAHFELGPGRTSLAVRHRSVDEIWYFVGGRGEMWRRQGDTEEVVPVKEGVCLTIPRGTEFQFRSYGNKPLAAVGITMPPWPGGDEAILVPGTDAWHPESSRPTLAELDSGSLAAVYGDTLAGIWETDGISFKLLGLVPVVSAGGASILVALLDTEILGPVSIGFLGLLGMITTFAVYRWELRNIQTCERLWHRAADAEERLGFGRLVGREDPPPLLGVPVGKKEAEHVIYGASLAAWLLPVGAAIAMSAMR